MALASGADVEIEGNQFMLATDVEEPYIHQYENLYPTTAEVAGTDKKTANQNILLWSYDNFIEGDGLKYYDEDQPRRWHTGNNNPRNPGSIQSPPDRAQTSQTTGITPTSGSFTTVGGNLWYFTGDEGFYSSDNGATWTENTDVTTEVAADTQITAACSDGALPYFVGVIVTSSNESGIWRCDSTTVATDVVTTTGSMDTIQGIAVKEQYLYAWNGSALYRFDILNESLPITFSQSTHRVYRLNDDATPGTYGDIKASDQGIIMLRASNGLTDLHEWRLDPQTGKTGGRRFWTMVDGFTGKKICISSGVLYVLGDYQDRIALWGYSLQTRQPLFLGYVGEAVGVDNVRFIAPSYGAQVMIGVDDGTTSYIYIYDAEEDAFSQLDERTIAADGTLLAGVTARNRRVTSHFSTTTTKFNRWSLDSDTPTGAWDWDSAAFDFGYPQDEKVLLGFHVIQDPQIASGTVNIDYQLDEDGSWIDTGVTTSAGAKHTYIQVSTGTTTRKFRTLRMRMTGASGCRVLSITARAYVNTKQEVWRLVLDLRNEPGTTRRLSDRSVRAARVRDLIHSLVATGSVVDFKDGRRYPDKSDTENTGFKAHECLIEFPKDSIDSATEGRCEIILRSVDPSA